MAEKSIVVTLDGPSGSGKSTVARKVAEALGFRYLDTGAMYRAATLAALRSGVRTDPADEEGLEGLLGRVDLDVQGRVLLDGGPVGAEIRSEEVTQAVSSVSACAVVRRRMVGLQRSFARRSNLVAEGRDLGTVVFPDAPHRFYLDASPEERARRRALQEASGCRMTELDHARAMRERDRKDSGRAASPLRIGPGTQVIDTTDLTADQVVQLIVGRIREAHGGRR